MGYIKIKIKKSNSQYKSHVHEVQGYLKMAEDKHYHRYSFITGEAIFLENGNHCHEIVFQTDNTDGHFHEYKGRICGAIPMGDKHVHYLEGITTDADGHAHGFRLVTLMDNPTDVL
ncbi:hypothetical protein bsdcttw_32520 [Anaerocolumna chitinilytica]|uniref:YmaF family protein n=2 Tax=Anaerocolumna chitinilytica TaxID=1727145 RepID=A0A7I8DSK8_9FIRM|nr:hypothetical protein bsdcttw_32520 [Anaerocolumna chitinilytica]